MGGLQGVLLGRLCSARQSRCICSPSRRPNRLVQKRWKCRRALLHGDAQLQAPDSTGRAKRAVRGDFRKSSAEKRLLLERRRFYSRKKRTFHNFQIQEVMNTCRGGCGTHHGPIRSEVLVREPPRAFFQSPPLLPPLLRLLRAISSSHLTNTRKQLEAFALSAYDSILRNTKRASLFQIRQPVCAL